MGRGVLLHREPETKVQLSSDTLLILEGEAEGGRHGVLRQHFSPGTKPRGEGLLVLFGIAPCVCGEGVRGVVLFQAMHICVLPSRKTASFSVGLIQFAGFPENICLACSCRMSPIRSCVPRGVP